MKEARGEFPCGDLLLEGIITLPEGEGPFPAVVVCHPHPLYGGNMDNNVVLAVCQALVAESMVTLRFNFRGVGNSEGKFGQGVDEQQDAIAAISCLDGMKEVDLGKIGLAGYSFGATVALSTAPKDERVQAVVAISPPLSSPESLKEYLKPKLLLCGGKDAFIPQHNFLRLVDGLPEPKEQVIIPNADHFWWGCEEEAVRRVADFFASVL